MKTHGLVDFCGSAFFMRQRNLRFRVWRFGGNKNRDNDIYDIAAVKIIVGFLLSQGRHPTISDIHPKSTTVSEATESRKLIFRNL
jgi:hypothetical protein